MIIESVCVGEFQVNCYCAASGAGKVAIIIDPGDEEDKIRRMLGLHKLKPGLIINTHGHIDHIGCDDAFGVIIYAHRDDAALLKDPQGNLSAFLSSPFRVKSKAAGVEDKQTIELDGIELEVIHTPGHTRGGMCLLLKKPQGNILFSGDTLFYQGIGRTDFPGADGKLLIKSIKEKLLILPDETIVYPGHGEATTIGEERKHNPFL